VSLLCDLVEFLGVDGHQIVDFSRRESPFAGRRERQDVLVDNIDHSTPECHTGLDGVVPIALCGQTIDKGHEHQQEGPHQTPLDHVKAFL